MAGHNPQTYTTKLILGAGKIRQEGHYLYAPTIIIKPGVLNGLLVDGDDIAASWQGWNGRPVTVGHPVGRNGEPLGAAHDPDSWAKNVVGFLFDVRYEDGLRGTMQIDLDRVRAHPRGDELLVRLKRGDAIDVSTGYFAAVEDLQGEYHGQSYIGRTADILPDHVAILLDERGACDWQMGCGVPRINVVRVGEISGMEDEQVYEIDLSGVEFAGTLPEGAKLEAEFVPVEEDEEEVLTDDEAESEEPVGNTAEVPESGQGERAETPENPTGVELEATPVDDDLPEEEGEPEPTGLPAANSACGCQEHIEAAIALVHDEFGDDWAEVADILANYAQQRRELRAELTGRITANSAFTGEELAGMELTVLKKLAESVGQHKPEPDFTGQKRPAQNRNAGWSDYQVPQV